MLKCLYDETENRRGGEHELGHVHAAAFAMAAAALSVRKAGAIPSIPCLDEIETFLGAHKG